MIKILSEKLEKIFEESFNDAKNNKQEYMVVENILKKIIENDDFFKEFAEYSGIDYLNMLKEIEMYLKELNISYNGEPKQTILFKKLVQDLIFRSRSSGKIAQPMDVFLTILELEDFNDTFAKYILQKYKIDSYMVKEFLSEKEREYDEEFDKIFDEVKKIVDEGDDENEEVFGRKRNKKNILEEFGTNLTKLAKEGKIDPVIGRDEETLRVIQVLARKKKNNPLLIGEAGVGKTSIVEKLALDIVNNKVPKAIKGWEVWSIDPTSMVAGAKFRGDFEKRLKLILEELEKRENVIAFFDEFHTMFGLGANSSSQLDATNILKPALMNGKIRIIGATTFEDAKQTIDKNKAMLRRFQKVIVEEPDNETTLEILKGIAPVFEKFHGVKYSDEILKMIVKLSGKYLTDTHFPDKAIDVLDEIGAIIRIKEEENGNSKPFEVTKEDIAALISKKARVPVELEEIENKEDILHLEERIKSKLFGQDSSVEKVVDKIVMVRAGLNEPNKPLGAFLFAGPSGVGKTELGRLLAKELGIKLLRYDMSEFNDSISINKLIGSSAGYVGYEEGGRLVQDIRKHPHSVLILDEIEKAHPKVLNTFLQILEEAELTDSTGQKADFRNVLIIFTTNAGSKISKTVGFGKSNVSISKSMKQIEETFSPEFRNRLDGIIMFNPLNAEQIGLIVDKIIGEIEELLSDKNIKFNVDDAAKEFFVEKGFDPELGARPMKRVIQDFIKKPLSKMIINGEVGENVVVNVKYDKERDEIFLEV